MELKNAEAKDHVILTEIARQGKAFWGYTDSQMSDWSDILTISEKYITENKTIKLVCDGKISGFYSLLISENQNLQLDFFFLLPEFIGKGFGRRLIEDCVKRCKNLNINYLLVDADPNAENFYHHFGFVTYNYSKSSIKNRFLPQMKLKL